MLFFETIAIYHFLKCARCVEMKERLEQEGNADESSGPTQNISESQLKSFVLFGSSIFEPRQLGLNHALLITIVDHGLSQCESVKWEFTRRKDLFFLLKRILSKSSTFCNGSQSARPMLGRR
jgi:hypothetical protein